MTIVSAVEIQFKLEEYEPHVVTTMMRNASRICFRLLLVTSRSFHHAVAASRFLLQMSGHI